MREFILIFISIFIVSCATGVAHKQPVQKSNLTFATVKTHLIKGKTSQAEVIQLLGNPNIVTKGKNGVEIWSYSKQSFESGSSSSSAMGGFILFGASQNTAFSQSASSTFDLVLKFNDKDILLNYSVRSSKF